MKPHFKNRHHSREFVILTLKIYRSSFRSIVKGYSMLIQSIIYGNPDYYPPMIHGAEILDRHGFQQEILSRRFRSDAILVDAIDEYYPTSTVVFRLNSAGKGTASAFLSFAWNVLRKSNRHADFFIGYNAHGFALARLLGYLYRKPIVYHSHDFMEDNQVSTFGDRIFKVIERRFAHTAEVVIVPDRERAQIIAEQLHLDTQPLIVANCPVHPPASANSLLHQTLKTYGKSFERIVWRQGMINKTHGLEVTIRSIPFWSSPNWGFVIMGLGDLKYKEKLLALASDLGVADRFVILPAVGDYREVSQFTIDADIGHALYEPLQVNHTFITTASNKTMEYQAAGLPILLADTPGSRKLVDKYQHGVLVDVTSPEAIAAGINHILNNSQLAQQMSEGSKRAFREEFNYETQYLPAIQRFKELARSRK